jgi:hypothetical protein
MYVQKYGVHMAYVWYMTYRSQVKIMLLYICACSRIRVLQCLCLGVTILYSSTGILVFVEIHNIKK